jgi:DNA-binding SARP family transcriptional activator
MPVGDLISLNLLGGFGLRVGARAVDVPASAQRVLALLGVRGGMSRGRIAGTLWPEVAEERAMASLRTCLWRIQQIDRGVIAASPTNVELADELSVDIRELTAAARLVLHDGVDHLSPWWSSARFHGELLPDWSEDWLVIDRERLRQLRLHALERLAERLTAQGRYGLALEAALAAVRADSLRETAHRAAILVHLAEGNLGEALRQFQQCRDILLEEFGVEPTPATAQLMRGIAAHV